MKNGLPLSARSDLDGPLNWQNKDDPVSGLVCATVLLDDRNNLVRVVVLADEFELRHCRHLLSEFERVFRLRDVILVYALISFIKTLLSLYLPGAL